MKAINIIWDTDGEIIDLPLEIEIPIEIQKKQQDHDDAISDYISDVTGFCHKGFEISKSLISLCCDCAYCGDKFSFPLPNDKIECDPSNPFIKHFYCCCGDCDNYDKDITPLGIQKCSFFEEI